MAITNLLSKRDYTVGVKLVSARNIPINASNIKVTALREGWKPRQGMRMQIQVSLNGGGGDMIIDNVTIANGQNIRFISWTETESNPD